MSTAKRRAPQVVLITGCSSGIGEASALRLHRDGNVVYATARRDESVAELRTVRGDERWRVRRLDVTDSAEITAVVGEIHERHGAVDVLINNAGFGQVGAVEEIPIDRWRGQLETNLVACVALTQACLPAMRARRSGRIICLSSVVAHVSLPLMAAYCASKHALDAVAVALRNEVAAFGIDVVLVEPGPIRTEFRTHVDRNLAKSDIGVDGPYAALHAGLNRRWQSRFSRQNTPPERVAKVIACAVRARRPRRRYRVTPIAHWLPRVLPWIPESWFDTIIRRNMSAGRD